MHTEINQINKTGTENILDALVDSSTFCLHEDKALLANAESFLEEVEINDVNCLILDNFRNQINILLKEFDAANKI